MAATGTLTEAARKGWRWWTGELRSCVPRRVRALALSKDLRVELAAQSITIRRSARSATSFPLPIGAADREAAVRMLKRRRVAIVFDAGRAVTSAVELPLAAERSVHQALRYEVDRRTPFKADQVHLGYRVRLRDAAGRRLVVDMICVPKRLIEPVRDILDDAQASIGNLSVDLPQGVVDLAFNADRGAAGGAGRIVALGWALGLGAALAGVLVPLVRLEDVAELRLKAARAGDLERQIAEITNREKALDAFLADKAPLVLLAELARITGDDTHLTGFRFDGNSVSIDGSARSAAGVAQVIEGSPHFRNPTFRVAVTPTADDAEHFSLSIDIERAAPEKR
jgi:general secretion pathway protein L